MYKDVNFIGNSNLGNAVTSDWVDLFEKLVRRGDGGSQKKKHSLNI